MRKHIRSTSLPVLALSFVVLGTMLPGTLSNSWALAADDCVAKPNSAAPSGQHWWYRTDRAAKRKCWFLGPQDKEAAARKADQREHAEAATAEPETPADAMAAQPAATQSAPPAPAARSDANAVPSTTAVPSFVHVTQESVPYLVDWSGLLKGAGIVTAEENAMTGWAEDSARTAWAMQNQQEQEPVEPQTGKEDARAPQTAAARADIAKAPAAATSGLPATTIAAILIAAVTGPAIFSIARARRRRNSPRKSGMRATGVFQDALPAFLQRHDATLVPPGQQHDQEPDQDYGRAYGGEEELRRILEGVPRRAA